MADTITVSGFTTQDIHNAAIAAGEGGTVIFPAGTYDSDGLKVSGTNQTWQLERGAVIKRNNTTLYPLLTIEANGWRLRGGEWDGNRYVNTHVAPGISCSTGGYSLDMEDFDLHSVTHWGISHADGELRLNKFNIRKTGQAAVFWRITPSGVSMNGPQITDGTVSRTLAADYTDSGCIIILGQATKRVTGSRVMNVKMSCYNPVGRVPNNSGGVAIFAGDYSVISECDITGGRMAVSLSDTDYTVIAKNSFRASSSYHVELVKSHWTTVSSNTMKGTGGNTAVENNKSNNTRVSGNTISNVKRLIRLDGVGVKYDF